MIVRKFAINDADNRGPSNLSQVKNIGIYYTGIFGGHKLFYHTVRTKTIMMVVLKSGKVSFYQSK